MLQIPYPNVSLITPGGIAEIFMGNGGEDAEHIYIRDRKGFVKLALRAGADLVPTYGYGERQI